MWNMRLINMPAAWDLEKGSSSVTVAVLDTGVANHPDLAGRIVPGYDFDCKHSGRKSGLGRPRHLGGGRDRGAGQ